MKTESLKINIADLLKDEVYSSQIYEVDAELDDEDDVTFPKPLHIIAHMTKADEGVMAEVEIRGEIELECSRCAEKFKQKVLMHVSDVYESNSSEESRRIDKDLNVDLLPIVREEILISIPIKRLCKENCKGRLSEGSGEQKEL